MQVLGFTPLGETSSPNSAIWQSTRVGRRVGCLRESTAAELNSRVKKTKHHPLLKKKWCEWCWMLWEDTLFCWFFFFFLSFMTLCHWAVSLFGNTLMLERGWYANRTVPLGGDYSQKGLGGVLGESWLVFVELNYQEVCDVEEKGMGRKDAGWERYAQDKWSSTQPISSKSLFHVGLEVWKKLLCMWGAESCRAVQNCSAKVCSWGMCWCLQLTLASMSWET